MIIVPVIHLTCRKGSLNHVKLIDINPDSFVGVFDDLRGWERRYDLFGVEYSFVIVFIFGFGLGDKIGVFKLLFRVLFIFRYLHFFRKYFWHVFLEFLQEIWDLLFRVLIKSLFEKSRHIINFRIKYEFLIF